MSEAPVLSLDFSTLILIAIAAGALLSLLFVIAVALVLRRAPKRVAPPPEDLTIDIRGFPAGGPPEVGPQLQIYGCPVRLAVVVLAPAGRESQLPAQAELSQTLNGLIPGLSEVCTIHKTEIRRWKNQLSAQGFTHSFFNFVPLPGDRGKGSPWCCIAGRFEVGSRQLLAGFVCCAASPNSLGQIVIQHTGQWMDIVRVRSDS